MFKRASRSKILVFAALLLAAPVTAIVLARWFLLEPDAAFLEFTRIFLVSEAVSLTVGYIAFRTVARLRLASIQLKVALGFALGLGVTALSIMLISLPMFISAHDANLLIVVLIFAGVLSLAFGGLLARSITTGVEQLTHSAQEIAKGNLRARAQVYSGDEVERLAEAFNRMAARLEEAFARQQELEQARRDVIAAVSHDLRTPLASLRAVVEALNDGVVSDAATVERYLHSAQVQVESLSLLVDDLFELAQLDAGVLSWTVEPSSLRDLISDTLESMHAQAQEQQVKLSGSVEPGADPVLMNPHKVQRVLDNLIQNAIRHTPADGTVVVLARPHADEVQVDVVDSGEGIAEADLPHVFDRFYRGDKSRSRETGGAGLGLAIARGIVQAHNGRIWVESQKGRGSCFSFTLPRAATAPRNL